MWCLGTDISAEILKYYNCRQTPVPAVMLVSQPHNREPKSKPPTAENAAIAAAAATIWFCRANRR